MANTTTPNCGSNTVDIAALVRSVAAEHPTRSVVSTMPSTSAVLDDTVTVKPMTDDDDHHNNDENPNSTIRSSKDQKYQYQRLPFYGEHKRAISTVKIAPHRICYGNNNRRSSNANANNDNNIYETMTASASADGVCKLWNISLPYYYDHSDDTDDDHHTNLIPGIMRSTTYQNSTNKNTKTTADKTSSPKQHRNQQQPLPGGATTSAAILTPYITLSGSHSRGINDISWNPHLPYIIATASDDKTVKIWDCLASSSGSGCSGSSNTNNTSSTGTPTTAAAVYNSNDTTTTTTMVQDPIVELIGHDHFVFCVDQYRNMVATGSFDETIKLWDIRTGYCISTLPAHSDPVTSVAFNRDGTMIVSGSHDGLIRFWDVMTGECLKTLYAQNNPPVSSVTFAPNSKYILAGTLDNTLRLWPVTTTTTTNSCTKTYRYNEHTMDHNSNIYHGTSIVSNRNNRNDFFRNTKYSIASAFTCHGNILVGNETGHPILFDLQTGHVQQILHQQNNNPPESNTTTTSSATDNLDTSVVSGGENDTPTNTNSTTKGSHSSNSSGISNTNNAVLAVSAHDTQPFLCTGSMGTKRVEFWSLQPVGGDAVSEMPYVGPPEHPPTTMNKTIITTTKRRPPQGNKKSRTAGAATTDTAATTVMLMDNDGNDYNDDSQMMTGDQYDDFYSNNRKSPLKQQLQQQRKKNKVPKNQR